MAYDFHYTLTGTGVISGKEVLEQTEDAINDLGNTAISGVQEALDKAEQALTNSANAVDDAQTALNTANNAEGVAIQAQTDVGNLSGTVTNIGNRVTTAEGNISNLQGRMTTAETNIGNLQGRMTTAETNIGNLQTAVSTAQATANSAQQTATTARQQSYVFRYSGTAVVPNSTIAYSTIDNTDNIKSGDKILDVDGKLFEITAVDTTNQTVTVGTALIDLALDANVVHTSGDETISGTKAFSATPYIYNSDSTENSPNILFRNSKYSVGDTTDTGEQRIIYTDKNGAWVGSISSSKNVAGTQYLAFTLYTTDNNNANISSTINYYITKNGDRYFTPSEDSQINLGSSSARWNSFNGLTPSSLGMPNFSGRVNITGYISNLTGNTNIYTPSVNGWLYVGSNDASYLALFDTGSGGCGIRFSDGVVGEKYACIPCQAGRTLGVKITCTNLAHAYFVPCLGNI